MTYYFVSDTPNEKDFVVGPLVTDNTAVHDMESARWQVTRVNFSTGRGTVRHVETDKALQVVRGRFGWRLADGTARAVRFCREIAAPEASVADGALVIFEGDVNCGEPPFEPTREVVEDPTDPVLLWVAPYIPYGQWHAVVTTPGDEGQTALCGHPIAADALVYDRVDSTGITCPLCKSRPACTECGEVHGQCTPTDEDEDPDNDPCDLCDEPTSPLYLVGRTNYHNGSQIRVCPLCVTAWDASPASEPYTTAARKRDWVEIGRKATEALARHEARLQRQADLLFELLGKLNYYADNSGYIRHRNSFSDKMESADLGELVREFRTRAQDETTASHRYGDPCRECGQPALDYNTPLCDDCKRKSEYAGTDKLSQLYTPGKAEVLKQLRGETNR